MFKFFAKKRTPSPSAIEPQDTSIDDMHEKIIDKVLFLAIQNAGQNKASTKAEATLSSADTYKGFRSIRIAIQVIERAPRYGLKFESCSDRTFRFSKTQTKLCT